MADTLGFVSPASGGAHREFARGRHGQWPVVWIAKIVLFASLLTATAVKGQAAEIHADARLVPTPEMRVPGYLQPTTDPAFGTPIVRVTDPGRQILPGVFCKPSLCRHRYSSAQAWNADQTLLVITTGCPGLCFLDGQTYRPLFHRRVAGACEWHPTDPELMICMSKDEIYALAVRSGTRKSIFVSSELGGFRFGPGKGNLSKDGRRLVVRALNKAGALVAFAYDLVTAKKYPEIALAQLEGENSYCSISPSGRYIFCLQRLPDRTNTGYVFTLEGVQLQHWGEHHRPGHGDMTIDSDGSDVYVGISKSDPDKFQVIKRRLVDGAVTVLTPRGVAQHASIRNINRPGWVFLTYGGSYAKVARSRNRLPFYREILALRIDGSGEMRRIVHTRSAKDDYYSEAHGSPSPDGSQVIWASNWGEPGAPIADYVARVSWPDHTAKQPARQR